MLVDCLIVKVRQVNEACAGRQSFDTNRMHHAVEEVAAQMRAGAV